MSITETAELKLKELNGGRFQILATRYVSCKYGIPSIHHSGRSFGTEETTIGTPDCFLAKPNGHFIYIECGKRGGKGATLAKLREDVEHCLDYEKDHPEAGEIDEIVCCYGFPRLSSSDLHSIQTMDKRVSLVGPEEIAEACVSKYPWLARDYLGIEVGSGAFLDAQAFIERNHNDRFAPDLDQCLIGRDRELANVHEAILHNQAVLLSGPSGCGKTKLAFEACQTLVAAHDAAFYVVNPTRQEIYEDLRVFLSDDRLTYLLLDDANRLAGLGTAVNYVLDRPNIKLIVTCRNYTKESVVEELKRIKRFKVIDLNPLSTEDFNQVLETEMCLGNTVASSRIASIVNGNLRLAFLLSEADGDSDDVTTMQELLEAVYKDKLSSMCVIEQQTIAIASILGPHMTEGNDQLDTLLQHFDLSREAYIASCHTLHDRELLDATQAFEAVSFEEQNLRDYFLYHSLAVTSVIQLSDLWNMRNGEALCTSSLNTVLTTFHDEQIRRELMRQAEDLLHATQDDDEALRVIDALGIFLGRAGFSRLCSIISSRAAASNEEVSYRSFVFDENRVRGSFHCLELSALSPFLLAKEYSSSAVRLLFNLLKHVRLTDSDAEELFERRLCAGRFLRHGDTKLEDEVLHILESGGISVDGSAEIVFKILFAKGILSDVLHYTQALTTYEVGFGMHYLAHTDSMVDLRAKCLQMLLREHHSNSQIARRIESVCLGYRHYPYGDSQLSKVTYEQISQSMSSVLRFGSLEECKDVHGFIAAATRAGVDVCETMLAELGVGKRFAMRMLDVSSFPDDEVIGVFAEEALKLQDEGWAQLLDLISAENQRFTDTYILDRVLVHVLKNTEVSAALKGRITRSIKNTAAYLPGTIDVCTAQYLERFGQVNGRKRIIEEMPSRMDRWLVCFDQQSVIAGHAPTLNQLTESLERYGEVLPFATVCEMEKTTPGIFVQYVRELGKRVDIVAAAGWHYLPYSLDKLNSCMTGECRTPENWTALAELMCSLASFASQHPSKEVVGSIIRKVPDRLENYFAAIVQRKSYDAPDVPWTDIFEAVDVESAIEAIGRVEKNALTKDGNTSIDYGVHQSCRRLVLDALTTAGGTGIGTELDEWVCERIAGTRDEIVDLLVDASTALDYQHRFKLAMLAAHAGVDASQFSRVAFGFPFDGVSWSGSEQPLLRKQLEYYESIESQILGDGLFEYQASASEAIRMVKNEQQVVRVREFVDPYVRHDNNN